MNKWLYRAVGTVGIASGILLLGSGAAHANETEAGTTPAADPQALRGLFDDLLTPAAGLHPLGLSVDTPGTRLSAGLVPNGPLAVRPNSGQTGLTAHVPGQAGQIQDVFIAGQLPDLADVLPATDLLPLGRHTAPTHRTLPVIDGTDPAAGQVDGDSPRTLPAPAPDEEALPLVGDVAGGLPLAGGDLPLVGGGGDLPLVNSLPLLGGGGGGGGAGRGGLPLVGDLPVLGNTTSNLSLINDGGLLAGMPAAGAMDGAGPLARGALNQLTNAVPAVLDAVPQPLRPKVATSSLGLDVPGLGGIGVDGGNSPSTASRSTASRTDEGRGQDRVVEELPLVGGLLKQGGGGLPLVGGLPVVGGLVQQTAGPGGVGGALGGLPLVGGLPVVGGLLGNGAPAGPVQPATGQPLPDQPVTDQPTAVDTPADDTAANAGDSGDSGDSDGTAREMPQHSSERPVAGEDVEYAESTSLRASENLPLVGSLSNLPLLGVLRTLPLVSPLVQQLPLPMNTVRSLPVVGSLVAPMTAPLTGPAIGPSIGRAADTAAGDAVDTASAVAAPVG